MRAFVITGPGEGGVQDVNEPLAAAGQVVVDVERVGVCGTDVEFFAGTMPYLHDGQATYPLRPGHEWAGTVSAVGPDVAPDWIGVRVTGDTMLGCGKCERCIAGNHHVCADRFEIGIRGGWHGALAEKLLVPATALRKLPSELSLTAAALVEPGGSALRAVEAGQVTAGTRVCVWGPGTIGLLAAQFAMCEGATVDIVGTQQPSLRLARELGVRHAYGPEDVGERTYDVVIDASNSPAVGALAVEQVEPSGRVVLVGLADTPSVVDLRRIVLRDVTIVGILGASAGLDRTIEVFSSGRIKVDPLVAATVGLEEVANVLAGRGRRTNTGAPKVHVDPRR